MSTTIPKVSSIASWFGSNRMLAPIVGREFDACSWVGIVFAGGCSEAAHIKARSLYINDKHAHVINMGRVMGHPKLGPMMFRQIRRKTFDQATLTLAQDECRDFERRTQLGNDGLFGFDDCEFLSEGDALAWAVSYFVAAWMPRHGTSGTKSEFDTGLSTRWNANGGDSATHYWSATESWRDWRRIMQRGNFTTLDFAEFIPKCKDDPEVGIYSDAPFKGPGDAYAHTFGDERQGELARLLGGYKKAKVVVRFYDIPLVRELYPADKWNYRILVGRKQTNAPGPEVLLTNRVHADGTPATSKTTNKEN